MTRVVVAGAYGLIGSYATDALARTGHDVRAFALYDAFNSCRWLDHCGSEAKGQFDMCRRCSRSRRCAHSTSRPRNGFSSRRIDCDTLSLSSAGRLRGDERDGRVRRRAGSRRPRNTPCNTHVRLCQQRPVLAAGAVMAEPAPRGTMVAGAHARQLGLESSV